MLKKIYGYILGKVNETGAQYKAYGIFGIFNFPFYYIFWLYLSPETYENLLLRAICTLLCCLLIFHNKWPNQLKKYLPIYWCLTLTFTLPFFFTFMLIMNHGSAVWITNTIVIVFFMLLLVEWTIAVMLLLVGSLFGVLAASFFVNEFFPAHFDYLGFFITYLVSIVIGVIFTHNKQVIETIRRRSIKAEANSKAKSEFIANMSHDLRTPITGMLGMIQDMLNTADRAQTSVTMKEELSTTKTLNHMIDTVKRDGSHLMHATDELLQLCNEILEVVRLESGKLEDNEDTFELELLIQHNVELLRPMATHKDLELIYNIHPDVPVYFKGIRVYLDRILLNLTSNALKFTEGGHVKIIAELCNEPSTIPSIGEVVNLQLHVEDSGVGIPTDKFDTIFEHFSRLTPSYDGLYKGAGLGLYTVKRYTEAMKGHINVRSEVNKGTCFTVTLPLTVSDHAAKVKQPVNSSKPVNSFKDKPSFKCEPTPRSVEASHRILVVEDNELAAIAVTLALEPFHCHVETASNGNEALNLVQAHHYDLIFMDIGLPDLSGFEVTKKIRQLESPGKQIPIIALTGHASDSVMHQKALNAGMQDVLTKPAQFSALESILQQYMFDLDNAERRDKDELATFQANDTTLSSIIDWDTCVHMLGDDPKLAYNVLAKLVEDLKNTKITLSTAYMSHDIEALCTELHRVRGGVCYLKLPQLEQALKIFHEVVKTKPQDELALENTYVALQQAMDDFWETWRESDFSPK